MWAGFVGLTSDVVLLDWRAGRFCWIWCVSQFFWIDVMSGFVKLTCWRVLLEYMRVGFTGLTCRVDLLDYGDWRVCRLC